MNSVTIKNLPILTKLPDVRQQFKPRSLQHVLSKDSTKYEICKLVNENCELPTERTHDQCSTTSLEPDGLR